MKRLLCFALLYGWFAFHACGPDSSGRGEFIDETSASTERTQETIAPPERPVTSDKQEPVTTQESTRQEPAREPTTQDAGIESTLPEEPGQSNPDEAPGASDQPTSPEPGTDMEPRDSTSPEPGPDMEPTDLAPPESGREAVKEVAPCSNQNPCQGGLICRQGQCVPCRTDTDCGQPSCQSGSTCQQNLPVCAKGRCSVSQRSVKDAVCESAAGYCRYKQDLCAESYEGAQLSTAIYPSEPLSALPGKFKRQQTINGPNGNGTMMFFQSDAPHTICHVVFKGVSPNSIKDLIAALTSIKDTSCKDSTGQKIGDCGVGFYSQYEDLRKAGVMTYVRSQVNSGQCPGGLRVYGHSMGGALASLFATDLQQVTPATYTKTYMRIYTYGEPRLYKKTTAASVHKLVTKVRWVHDGDPIPSSPPSAAGYQHFGQAYEVKRSSGKTTYKDKGTDYSPSIDWLDLTDAHKYSTYVSRLKDCKI